MSLYGPRKNRSDDSVDWFPHPDNDERVKDAIEQTCFDAESIRPNLVSEEDAAEVDNACNGVLEDLGAWLES